MDAIYSISLFLDFVTAPTFQTYQKNNSYMYLIKERIIAHTEIINVHRIALCTNDITRILSLKAHLFLVTLSMASHVNNMTRHHKNTFLTTGRQRRWHF